jgi:hypothetical protein
VHGRKCVTAAPRRALEAFSAGFTDNRSSDFSQLAHQLVKLIAKICLTYVSALELRIDRKTLVNLTERFN